MNYYYHHQKVTNLFSYKTQSNSLAWSAVFHSAEKACAYRQSKFVSAAASCFSQPIGHRTAETASRDKLGLAYVHVYGIMLNVFPRYQIHLILKENGN